MAFNKQTNILLGPFVFLLGPFVFLLGSFWVLLGSFGSFWVNRCTPKTKLKNLYKFFLQTRNFVQRFSPNLSFTSVSDWLKSPVFAQIQKQGRSIVLHRKPLAFELFFCLAKFMRLPHQKLSQMHGFL